MHVCVPRRCGVRAVQPGVAGTDTNVLPPLGLGPNGVGGRPGFFWGGGFARPYTAGGGGG